MSRQIELFIDEQCSSYMHNVKVDCNKELQPSIYYRVRQHI